MIFKYSELEAFLRHIKERYPISPLGSWDGSNAIILRHDIDLSIQRAYMMALIEKRCGVESTYLVMTTNSAYNPMSIRNRQVLSKISDLGFEVGLHFDPSVYPDMGRREIERKVDLEAEIVSSITGKEVRSLSLHNPSISEHYPIFPKFKNAYDKRISSPDRYLSDSLMIFCEDVYDFVKRVDNHPVQLVLHPLHYSEEGYSYGDIFYFYMRDYVKHIDAMFRVNHTYDKEVDPDIFTYIMRRTE